MTTRLGSLNEFCWMDLKTRDLAGTATFFSKTLGWRFAVDEEDWRKATKVAVDGHLIGGVSDLADPVYPPETPAHIAYYLAVDNVDRRAEAATVNGARLLVPPFDAGGQGRMATLIDPVGAAFSLWQPHHFTGWKFPPHTAGAPRRMVLACEQPDKARRFYEETTSTPLTCADFIAALGPSASAPHWELAVDVDDLDSVVARAHDHGHGSVTWSEETGRRVVRLSSSEGLAFQVRRLER
ncbi:VOC family protein [Streptomyces sp. NPDC088116]|uniref:VOC family protein n=1 Tax=Streptomyces sp. NPDC088116 TaxID=3365825 RepID=UPI0037F99BC5